MSMTSLFTAVGQTAGVGGIALGVLLIIFRDVIRRNIFPSLAPTHAYRIIRLVIVLTFSIAVLSIAAWVLMSVRDRGLASQAFRMPGRALVKLEYPTDGQDVERNVSVTALTQNLPSDYERWILVYAPGETKWYPTEVIEREDRFTTSVVVGAIDSYGLSFKIVLFITDSRGAEYLRGAVNGVLSLPDGERHEVIVKRAKKGV